jgi:DNA sulfur modification protein DndE
MRPLETIRLSQKERDRLLTLKRRTKIDHWNVICRWAFCLSLKNPEPPTDMAIASDSSVEMTWQTFGGDCEGLYLALLKLRCCTDQLDQTSNAVLAKQFRLHLQRGLGYLFADKRSKHLRDFLHHHVLKAADE